MKQLSTLLIAAFLTMLSYQVGGAQTPIDANLERIQQATVFVYQVEETTDNFFITCVGSGTLVSRDGLVLTNAHNSVQSEECDGSSLIIALSIRTDEPPVPLYRAEVAQVNVGLDLALLRITQNLDGRLLDTERLTLPFVALADSNLANLDDTVTVVGYPSLDDTSVQTVVGTLNAFISEPNSAGRAWMKTSASIPSLMSGGGAYNDDGELIGIPTTVTVTQADGEGCNFIQDTNADGLVNRSDTCVPSGGFINAIRPANFARPLLRAASLRLDVQIGTDNSLGTAVSTDDPQISRLFFATSVNDAELPTTIVNSLPSGSTSLYLFFDYTNMTPETIYEVRVTTDDVPNPTFSLAPVRWNGGRSGVWHFGISGQPWPNGIYDFTVFIDGVARNTASIVIGGAPTDAPQISDIVFGLSDLDGTPLGNGYVLPTGTTASARFVYRNMVDGSEWLTRWFYEDNEIFRTPPDVWRDGAGGAKTIPIQDPSGLLPGRYRLEIYVEGRLTGTSDFTIAGTADGAFPEVFQNTHFATAPSPQQAIEAPANDNFTTNIETLYGLFDWQEITQGTNWTIRWFVDDTLFYEERLRWQAAQRGENYLISLSSQDGLPDGTYRLELVIGAIRLATTEALIGIGQLPIDRFASPEGVQLGGRILDSETGEGISDVTFMLISEDFSVADFAWDAEQIYALATTDRNGEFQLERLLELSTEAVPVPYSVIIRADGYLPIELDGFVVDAETDNPLFLEI